MSWIDKLYNWYKGRHETWETVATDSCYTTFTDTGRESKHFFAFQLSSFGNRRVILTATSDNYGSYKEHNYYNCAKHKWEIRGELMPKAELMEKPKSPPVLRVIK